MGVVLHTDVIGDLVISVEGDAPSAPRKPCCATSSI